MDSQNTARVFSSMAALIASASSISTNLASQPKRLMVWLNCVTDPP